MKRTLFGPITCSVVGALDRRAEDSNKSIPAEHPLEVSFLRETVCASGAAHRTARVARFCIALIGIATIALVVTVVRRFFGG